ncbi:hypothetical protein HYDPIDRAFT_168311 [Hydnomerulius pinastri MD-312]|uniref:Fungal-type protein kinase domain-containing protein n=1 Tax=Hydnomerulius pinastri MD-312 TaxID=994086 RepID=A0A0C9WEG4_9AGAM|nr:hypothetical protein HYDPIDRAFT_168309 [Hydnomerulius pinastri MD-312]KIJ63919.1 hypothetical protein HYDPIDRAFT_168311 [Hydnomerulius pinastri MD-312]
MDNQLAKFLLKHRSELFWAPQGVAASLSSTPTIMPVIPESASQPGARMLQRRALLGPKPLTSHETPLAPAHIQSVPPAYRCKSDWYRDHMDPLVDKDTHDLHWSLDEDESICLLDALFPDKKLFKESVQRGRLVPSPSGGMAAVLNHLGKLYGKGTKGKRRWLEFPTSRNSNGAAEKKTTMEQKMAVFLNTVIDGLEAEVGPFKSKPSVPPTLVLTCTQQTDMGRLANVFWDYELRKKQLKVTWRSGGEESGGATDSHITLEQIVFISDALHGCGTTVWSGTMGSSGLPPAASGLLDRPLRKFTEGTILAMLNDAGVEGVPQLIHEQQVQGVHPTCAKPKLTLSTHTLRALLAGAIASNRPYQLRVLSRLVTEPKGLSIMFFTSLAELVVAFIDYVLSHRDAFEKASVLHHDISLLNLLIVVWDNINMDRRLDFLDHLPAEARKHLRSKLQNLPHQGFLADWGYAVPCDTHLDPSLSQPSSESRPIATPKPAASSPLSSPPPEPAASSPLSSLPPELASTSPILPPVADETLETIDYKSVPVQRSAAPGDGGPGSLEYVALSQLKHDKIVLLMGGDDPPDQSQPCIDTNPLYRTGTWSWMAAELVIAGPGKPVIHSPHHDLESLFYVLLGICVLYDEPHKVKTDSQLAECFDKYFNMFEPSLLKMITIQSEVGWEANIIMHISPYFQPLIPLLNLLREKIVLPMRAPNRSFHSDHITHNTMLHALVGALCELEDEHWVSRNNPKSLNSELECNKSHLATERSKTRATALAGHSKDLDSGRGGARTHSDSNTTSSEPLSEDSEVSTYSVGESHLEPPTTPRLPRPPVIRQVSRPGFSASSSAGSGSSAQKRFSDVEDSAESRQSKHQ